MGLGFDRAGFRLGGAFDLGADRVATHALNLPGPCVAADVRDLTGVDLMTMAGTGDVDVLAGGPPCQGFSKQGKGNAAGDDHRNEFVLEFVRLVMETCPRFFVFENVAVFGGKRGGRFAEAVSAIPGYRTFPLRLDCSLYAVAQKRVRFMAVGKRLDIPGGFVPPPPSAGPVPTVGGTLAGLPEPPGDFTEHPDLPNHVLAKISGLNRERISYVPPGGGWMDIPFDLRMDCHKRAGETGAKWTDVFGRLDPDKPCPTITGGFGSFTRGRFAHPFANRPLTAREAARLQGFPDWFRFVGSKAEVGKQVGNAVPPPVAFAVAKAILSCLSDT